MKLKIYIIAIDTFKLKQKSLFAICYIINFRQVHFVLSIVFYYVSLDERVCPIYININIGTVHEK